MDLPESPFSAFRVEPAELAREMRLAAAAKWYELARPPTPPAIGWLVKEPGGFNRTRI